MPQCTETRQVSKLCTAAHLEALDPILSSVAKEADAGGENKPDGSQTPDKMAKARIMAGIDAARKARDEAPAGAGSEL